MRTRPSRSIVTSGRMEPRVRARAARGSSVAVGAWFVILDRVSLVPVTAWVAWRDQHDRSAAGFRLLPPRSWTTSDPKRARTSARDRPSTGLQTVSGCPADVRAHETVVDDPKVPASLFGFRPLKRRHQMAPPGGDLGVPWACHGHAGGPSVTPSNSSADPSAPRIGCVASDKGLRCKMRSVRNEVWNAVRPTGSPSVTELTPV